MEEPEELSYVQMAAGLVMRRRASVAQLFHSEHICKKTAEFID